MSDKKEKSAVYNILAFTFEGEKTAADTVKQIKKSGDLDGELIVAEAIVSVNAKGKTHIHEPGHGVMGGAIGAVGGSVRFGSAYFVHESHCRFAFFVGCLCFESVHCGDSATFQVRAPAEAGAVV